ncbi:putative dna repair and transcription factor [Phaeomoniella chlamydospora]|uniref:Putative dna repair and transcription factor n=1 Tax=Phaeomoniella chlamydospora TaxID=158046 RepID=A0A0G2H812_PHACM|nr:putative dna repair and transcription factor [Phaeomoniella chlamydospora]
MNPYSTSSARWLAISSRDPKADTKFVYGVRSTKIYCRPICGARLARRANIEYFDKPEKAVAAGYRACKRCKPETIAQFQDVDEQAIRRKEGIQKAITLMTNRNGAVSLEEAAKEADIGSKWHFLRVFKEAVGETPGALMARIRGGASNVHDHMPAPDTLGSSSTTPDELHPSFTPDFGLDPLEAAWLTTDPVEMDRFFEQILSLDDPSWLIGETIPTSMLSTTSKTDHFDMNEEPDPRVEPALWNTVQPNSYRP